MPPKVVITNWVHPEVIDFLKPHCTLTANPSREPWSQQQVLERVEDAVALMTFMPDTVNDAFLTQCSQLRIIACALKGYDNFDVEACTRRGVWLTIVPDLLTVPAAELTVGLLIGLARHVHEGDRFIRSGAFRGWRPLLYGTGLAGSTVGVFGMGAIGKAIAQCLHGFGCGALLYYDERRLDPVAEQRLGLTCAPLRELVAQSDFLIIRCPAYRADSPQDRHLGFLCTSSAWWRHSNAAIFRSTIRSCVRRRCMWWSSAPSCSVTVIR